MKFDTLEHGLDAFRSHNTMSAEDVLYLMNLVCQSLQMDNSMSVMNCIVENKDDFIDELAKQLYNVFFIANPHRSIIEEESDDDLNEVRDDLLKIDEQIKEKKSVHKSSQKIILEKQEKLTELENLRRQNEQADAEKAVLDGKIEQLKAWLSEHPNSDLDIKREEYNTLKESRDELNAQISGLSKEISTLEPEVESRRQKKTEYEQRRNSLAKEKQNLDTPVCDLLLDIKNLQDEIKKITEKQEEQNRQKESIKAELKEEKEELERLRLEKAEEQRQLSETIKNINAIREETDSISQQISFYKNQLEDDKKKVNDPDRGLNAEKERLQLSSQQLQNEIRELNIEVNALRDKFKSKTQFREDIEKEVQDILLNEKNRLEDVWNYLTENLKVLGEKLKETQKEIIEKNSELKEQDAILTARRSEYEMLAGAVKSNNDEIAKLRREISEYKQGLEGFENPEKVKRDLESQRKELKKLTDKIQDIKQETLRVSGETAKLVEQKEEADREYDRVNKSRMNFSEDMVNEWRYKYTRSHNQLLKLEAIYKELCLDGSVLYADEKQKKLLENLDVKLKESLNTIQTVKEAIAKYCDSISA